MSWQRESGRVCREWERALNSTKPLTRKDRRALAAILGTLGRLLDKEQDAIETLFGGRLMEGP